MALARHKKRGELEEVSEEQQAEFKNATAIWEDKIEDYIKVQVEPFVTAGRVRVVTTLKTDASSEETQAGVLKRLLKPRVLLVNHEKRLGVDTTLANLAIKYNMIYLSVYQIIRQHIEDGTSFGLRLQATKKPRDILLNTQTKDEFSEADFSAAHFDLDLVIELLKHTLSQVRTSTQRYVLLEGLCNSSRLVGTDDRLELRLMDELFAVERNLGEVQAVIGLQFNSEKEYIDEDEVEFEQFDLDSSREDQPAAEGEEGGEVIKKKPAAFRPEDWKWTATDRRPRNLA